jgi:protein SCO1/2
MNMQTGKSAQKHALVKLAVVLLLGVSAGAGLFIATLRSSQDKPAAVANAGITADDLQGLMDQHETAFDSATLQGRYAVLYFGFTLCPDACPTALYNLTLALQQLDPDGKRIQPVFVSVDPARDTPTQLANYLSHFSEHIIGLTGPLQSVQLVEQSFGVIALEHRDESLSGGYTMDHSNEFLLLSPTGKLLMRLPAEQPADALLEQLKKLTKAETV